MTTRTRQPSVLRFIVLWCAVLFALTTGLMLILALIFFILAPQLFDITVENVPVGGLLAGLCAGFYGLNAAVYGVLIGAIHAALRGVLRRALIQAQATGSLWLIRYRLINLGYGLVVGAPLGVLGFCATADSMELLYIFGAFSIAFGIAGTIVGELVRPQFQTSIATEQMPPEPFPKRMLSQEEDELLQDAEEVIKRLESSEAKRRWATLNTLGQLSEPEEHILGAVTVLAAHDPIDYVREAAQSALLVWKKRLPVQEPDTDFDITQQRVAEFSFERNITVIPQEASPRGTIVTLEGDSENADFVFTWAHNEWTTYAVLTEEKTQQMIWEAYQAQILAELDKVKADGWEPEGEVGPAAIILSTFSKESGAAEMAIDLILSWNGGSSPYNVLVEPTELRVPLRRTKP